MSVSMKFTGGRDIEKALAALPQGTAKGVSRRAMKKEMQPVLDMANALSPSANEMFRMTSRVSRGQLGDSYVKFGPSVLNMFVGSIAGKGGSGHAHLIEFGTGPRYHENGKFVGQVSPDPMLQPAWDANKGQMLEGLGKRLWDEIEKTMARRAAKGAK